MNFDDLINNIKLYFPNFQIKYKDQSLLMRIIGTLLFFNRKFMTTYTTTIGSTVYFPSQNYIQSAPVTSTTILLHELVHIYDGKKISKYLFGVLYLFPQILIFLLFPMLFLSWKLALIFLVFLLPLPAYFRMYFEKRAYISNLYVLYRLGNKLKFNVDLEYNKDFNLSQFKNSYYYFMWPFSGINKDFDLAIQKIKNGERPFESPVFDILDSLINNIV
jgi:hypothetical protein